MLLFVIIVIIIIIILICAGYNIYHHSTLPSIHVYTNNKPNPLNVLVLSGTHGNESGPANYFELLVNNKYESNALKSKINSNSIPVTYVIVPTVNIDATSRNVRYTW